MAENTSCPYKCISGDGSFQKPFRLYWKEGGGPTNSFCSIMMISTPFGLQILEVLDNVRAKVVRIWLQLNYVQLKIWNILNNQSCVCRRNQSYMFRHKYICISIKIYVLSRKKEQHIIWNREKSNKNMTEWWNDKQVKAFVSFVKKICWTLRNSFFLI